MPRVPCKVTVRQKLDKTRQSPVAALGTCPRAQPSSHGARAARPAVGCRERAAQTGVRAGFTHPRRAVKGAAEAGGRGSEQPAVAGAARGGWRAAGGRLEALRPPSWDSPLLPGLRFPWHASGQRPTHREPPCPPPDRVASGQLGVVTRAGSQMPPWPRPRPRGSRGAQGVCKLA